MLPCIPHFKTDFSTLDVKADFLILCQEGDNDDTSGVRDAQLKEVTERLQAIAMEKDELYNVLESQRQQNASLRREMASNMDRISTLEGSSYHLRSENSELSAKVSLVGVIWPIFVNVFEPFAIF